MKKSLLFLFILIGYSVVMAQDCKYSVVESSMSGNDAVTITLNVDVKDKKNLEKEAEFAALKVLMFDGVPNTRYNRPFMKEGYKSVYAQHPTYFQTLYNTTSSDYISDIEILTKFKKSDNKTTKVKITVKPLWLRRNLESNGIIKRMGL